MVGAIRDGKIWQASTRGPTRSSGLPCSSPVGINNTGFGRILLGKPFQVQYPLGSLSRVAREPALVNLLKLDRVEEVQPVASFTSKRDEIRILEDADVFHDRTPIEMWEFLAQFAGGRRALAKAVKHRAACIISQCFPNG